MVKVGPRAAPRAVEYFREEESLPRGRHACVRCWARAAGATPPVPTCTYSRAASSSNPPSTPSASSSSSTAVSSCAEPGPSSRTTSTSVAPRGSVAAPRARCASASARPRTRTVVREVRSRPPSLLLLRKECSRYGTPCRPEWPFSSPCAAGARPRVKSVAAAARGGARRGGHLQDVHIEEEVQRASEGEGEVRRLEPTRGHHVGPLRAVAVALKAREDECAPAGGATGGARGAGEGAEASARGGCLSSHAAIMPSRSASRYRSASLRCACNRGDMRIASLIFTPWSPCAASSYCATSFAQNVTPAPGGDHQP